MKIYLAISVVCGAFFLATNLAATNEESLDCEEAQNCLPDEGFEITAKGNYGHTYLHDAAKNNQSVKAKWYIDKGGDLDAMTSYGYTALHLAARNGSDAVLELLIEKRLNLEVRNPMFDSTPLHMAAIGGKLKAAQMLIAAGADISATDRFSRTPLYHAINHGHPKLTKLLAAAMVYQHKKFPRLDDISIDSAKFIEVGKKIGLGMLVEEVGLVEFSRNVMDEDLDIIEFIQSLKRPEENLLN